MLGMFRWQKRAARCRGSASPAPGGCAGVERFEARTLLASVFVPMWDVRDLVYDDGRDVLYVASAGQSIARFDPTANRVSSLDTRVFGMQPYGLDVTADGSALFVAGAGNPAPTLVRIDLNSGAATARSFGSTGQTGYDVAIDGSGRGLMTTSGLGTAKVPVWEFDAATGIPTPLNQPAGGVAQYMLLTRSADRSVVLAQERATATDGLISLYDPATATFSPRLDVNADFGPTRAVSPDGSLFATPLTNSAVVFDRSLRTVKGLSAFAVGSAVAFSADGGMLYGANELTDELVGYDTTTWREKFRLPLGFDLAPGSVRLTAVSDDGGKLFLAVREGIWSIDLPRPTGQAVRFELSPVPRLGPAGTEYTFTLTARDLAGDVADDYRGTVRVTSTDPAAALPGDYTFTGGEGGTASFSVTLNTPGTHTLTFGDVANATLAVTSPTIAVHAGLVTFAPVTGGRELVYDPVRDLLYVTTGGGTVERLDVAGGRLLEAVQVGSPLNGADLTPDGSGLYVADALRGLEAGYVHRIDSSDLSVQTLSYADTILSGEQDSGAWDVAIAGNGKALVTAGFATGQRHAVRELELDSGEFAVRTDPYIFAPPIGSRVSGQAILARSADRSTVLLGEHSGAGYTYDADSDSVAYSNFFPSFNDAPDGRGHAVVSRDGALCAAVRDGGTQYERTVVFDRTFEALKVLTGPGGAVAFDPVRDTLYAADTVTDTVIAYDTRTWRERYRVPVGADVAAPSWDNLGPGNMVPNADGTRLFLLTAQGVSVIDLPQPAPASAATLEVTGAPALLRTGVPFTLTVTVRDRVGDVATGYRGRVTLTSTDGAAVLPGPYTFTPADAGVKSFTVTFNTTGSHTVTATDAAAPQVTGSAGPVAVHSGGASFVPIAGAQDVAYDAARNRLYVTTTRGTVERVDLNTRSTLPPIPVGSPLLGTDITGDDGTLYVADGVRGPTQAYVRKINLADGTVARVALPAVRQDRGAWDVAVAADGTALASVRDGAGNTNRLFEIDPATGVAAARTPTGGLGSTPNLSETMLSRSADGRFILLNPRHGYLTWFDAAGDTYDAMAWNRDVFGGPSVPNAVSRDSMTFYGLRAAFDPYPGIFNRRLETVLRLGGIDGGAAFDPRRAAFYGVNSTTDELVGLDTVGGSEKFRLPVGQDVPAAGRMGPGNATISDDGSTFFLVTPTGVRIIDLPRPTSDAGSFVVSGFARLIRTGVPGQFTVRAYDQQGSFFPGYRGTVRFSASDVAAGLPAEYTFTAADAGVHTFTATFNTAGMQSLIVRDASDPTATGVQSGIRVHAGEPGMLPIPSARDLVYDPVRNVLYATTESGLIERFDLATQTLLTPINVGGVVFGADITADGAFLYVAGAVPGYGPNTGTIAKVALADGSVSVLTFPLSGLQGTALDLAIAADGRAVFSSGFAGSGFSPLRYIDLATDTITSSGVDVHASTGSYALVRRGGDRSVVYVTELGLFPGQRVYRYTAADHQLVQVPGLQPGYVASVSRDGRYAAFPGAGRIVGPDMGTVTTLPQGLFESALFDPSRDVVYGIGYYGSTGVTAYDATTWAQFAVHYLPTSGPDAYRQGSGAMSVSGDGNWVFVAGAGGVHAVAVRPNLGVAARHVFYNRSAFDGNDAAASEADDAAIAPDKRPLRPGQAPSFANVTSYSRGINGIMVDVFNYAGATGPAAVGPNGPFSIKAGNGGDPAAWPDAPQPSAVTWRRGAGVGGSDRVTITWPDGALRNTWLQVTVKATGVLGINVPDVFYFGNLVGETGDAAPRMSVSALDFVRTRNAISARRAGIVSPFDHNRDGRVGALDVALARGATGRTLAPVSAPAAPMPAAIPSAPVLLRQDTSVTATQLLSEN